MRLVGEGQDFYAPGIGITGPMETITLQDGATERFVRPFRVRILGGRTVEVPVGMDTDYASVPRLFWRLCPKKGPYSPAAAIHDFLYKTGLLSKAEADMVFYDLMLRLGVPRWKARLMYWSVRLFGRRAWNACRREDHHHG